VGVQDKFCIRKVVDTGYSREERERRQDGGARKSGVTHATGYTCRKNMRGHRGRKVRARKDAEVIGLIIKIFLPGKSGRSGESGQKWST
jgi:hypothetical protein